MEKKESLWKKFERVVVKIFNIFFSDSKIKFTATPFYKDGGRDAHATWTIVDTSRNSSIEATEHTIWAEVKFRTKKMKIASKELSDHAVDAFLSKKVNTFYFVTNQDFTDNAKKKIRALLETAHCKVEFINNKRIVNIIQELAGDPTIDTLLKDLKELPGFEDHFPVQGANGVLPKWQINGCFQKDLSAQTRSELAATIFLHYNQVFFMILEIESCSLINTGFPELLVTPKSSDKVNISLYQGENQSRLNAQIKSLKKIYTVFPKGSGEISFADFDISLQGINPGWAAQKLEGSVKVTEDLKLSWAPSSWKSTAYLLYNRFTLWCHSECPGYFFSTLIGAAGYGKTFIVQHIINDAVKNHVLPMVIDGEYCKRPGEIAKKFLDWVFPINKVFDCDDRTREARLEFLTTKIHLPENVSRIFLNWLSNDWQKTPGETACASGSSCYLSREDLSRICFHLVQEIANHKRLLIIVEDLHKIDGATISYLITLHRILQYNSQGNIFFLWTSRWERGEKSPTAEIPRKRNKRDDNDKDNSWDRWFRNLMDSKEDNQLQIILKSFRRPEACQVLRESINGLNDKEAEWIVDHVGRSPYALKEGLLFLENKDIIQRRRAEGVFCRCFSEVLWNKISPRDLEDKTKHRLNAARNHSPLLRDLIEHGACLGLHFNINHVLDVIAPHSEEEIDNALKYCEKFDILSISHHGPGFWEFDHDLIRDAIIDTMGTYRHQSAARRLLTCLPPGGMSQWQQASLWFQAGDAEKVLDLTYSLVYGQRPAPEVLKAALLRFLVTDRLGKWDMVNSIPFIGWDEAIRADRVPHRPVDPVEDTREMLRTAEVIFDNLQILSSTACKLWDKLAVVCMDAAESIPDEKKRALFKHYSGRLHFDKMDFEKARKLFQESEEIFLKINHDIDQHPPGKNALEELLFSKNVDKKLIKEWFKEDQAAACGHDVEPGAETNEINQKPLRGVQAPRRGEPKMAKYFAPYAVHHAPCAMLSTPGRQRQENLLFLSFCYRHLDSPGNSESMMRKALALRQPGEWPIIARILANAGALYLHSNLEMTRLYWQRGYDFMKVCGITRYLAEFSINIGHLDILEDQYKSAEKHLEKGRKIAEEHHLKGEQIRYLIHKGCLALLQGAAAESGLYFEKALNYAAIGEHFRRIWRIRANLATVYEMKEKIGEAAWYDELTVRRMAPIVHRGEPPEDPRLLWKITRASCALGNLGLRARKNPGLYQPLLAKLDKDQRDVALQIADTINQGNIKADLGGLGAFLKTINACPRFLVTD